MHKDLNEIYNGLQKGLLQIRREIVKRAELGEEPSSYTKTQLEMFKQIFDNFYQIYKISAGIGQIRTEWLEEILGQFLNYMSQSWASFVEDYREQLQKMNISEKNIDLIIKDMGNFIEQSIKTFFAELSRNANK